MTPSMNWIRNCAVASVMASMIAGCASTNDRGLAPRPVEIAEFAQPKAPTAKPVAAAPAESKPVEPTAKANPAPDLTVQAATTQPPITSEKPLDTQAVSAAPPASPDTTEASATPGAAAAPPSPPAPLRRGERLINPGDMVVIDTVVGQVSGRPIFADALLEPIADQLRKEADRVRPADFPARAQQIIMNRLTDVVLTELFLAEAEASLTEQQQQGLFAFIRNLQEKTIATGRGSRMVTEERLREELGLTLEQYTQRERDTVLIRFLIDRKVKPRVIVSWKDVQREYKKRQAEFNPPASVTLNVLRLSTTQDADKIAAVKQRLAAADSYESVAEFVGPDAISTPDPFPMGPGGITDIPLNEDWKPYLKGLEVGQTSKPIETEGRVIWIHVAAIDQKPHQTLYDVQRQLETQLSIERENEERNRYINTLFARGIHDELNEMGRRVLAVALVRYGR